MSKSKIDLVLDYCNESLNIRSDVIFVLYCSSERKAVEAPCIRRHLQVIVTVDKSLRQGVEEFVLCQPAFAVICKV